MSNSIQTEALPAFELCGEPLLCSNSRQFPDEDFAKPEFAVLGRSNSGKSSLINKLSNRKKLARTSSTPGRTRLNLFAELRIHYPTQSNSTTDKTLRLIDLPGYGFGKMNKSEGRQSAEMVSSILHGRNLSGALLTMDIRRSLRDEEFSIFSALSAREIPVLLVANKADKLSQSQVSKSVKELIRDLEKQGYSTHQATKIQREQSTSEISIEVCSCSTTNRQGLATVMEWIAWYSTS